MRTERTPWTCRWSEFHQASTPTLWAHEWLAQWNCLIERPGGVRLTGDLERCAACPQWQPRGSKSAFSTSPESSKSPSRLGMWTLGVGL